MPTIHWSKLRAPLPWQHRLEGNTLIIPQVAQQDSGQYICNATSPTGHAEATIALHVESKGHCCFLHSIPCICGGLSPSNKSYPDSTHRTYGPLVSESVQLQPHIPFPQLVIQGSLFPLPQFLDVAPDRHMLPSDLCAPIAGPPYATTIPEHTSVRVGESVQLQCLAHGTPPLTFQWSRVGSSLPPRATTRNDVLRLGPVGLEDAGRYRCQVTNRVGSAEAFAQVVVQGEQSCHPGVFIT